MQHLRLADENDKYAVHIYVCIIQFHVNENQPFTYSWSVLLGSQLNRNISCPETGPPELPPARVSQGREQPKSKRKRTN